MNYQIVPAPPPLNMSERQPSTASGTLYPCPNGCGGAVSNYDLRCPSCRRPTSAQEIAVSVMCQQPEGACWEWWGPSDHRMRCRKPTGHHGEHSCHNDCGARGPNGSVCGNDYDHAGLHAWEHAP